MPVLDPEMLRAIDRDLRNAGKALGSRFSDYFQNNVLNAIDDAQESADNVAVAMLMTNQKSAGTVNATKIIKLIAPATGTISGLRSTVDTTVTTSDATYWTASAVNKGAAGTGTTAILAASDANTTKATGGSALTAYVARAWSLHGTPANLAVTKGDVIAVTFTKTGAAADLVEKEIELEVTPTIA